MVSLSCYKSALTYGYSLKEKEEIKSEGWSLK